jgi:hypothetical protein
MTLNEKEQEALCIIVTGSGCKKHVWSHKFSSPAIPLVYGDSQDVCKGKKSRELCRKIKPL